jgi:hypothetical protein
VDGHRDQRWSTSQPLWSSSEVSEFSDSAWPLYSIYSKIAKDEDNMVFERWQRETDGILIFVSSRFSRQMTLLINRET